MEGYVGKVELPDEAANHVVRTYIDRLTALRPDYPGQLRNQEPTSPPTVAELAERIKALKAAHTIEATPQRTGKRRVSAEEPVTARIRRGEQEAGGEWQRRISEREERQAAVG